MLKRSEGTQQSQSLQRCHPGDGKALSFSFLIDQTSHSNGASLESEQSAHRRWRTVTSPVIAGSWICCMGGWVTDLFPFLTWAPWCLNCFSCPSFILFSVAVSPYPDLWLSLVLVLQNSSGPKSRFPLKMALLWYNMGCSQWTSPYTAGLPHSRSHYPTNYHPWLKACEDCGLLLCG